MDTTIRSATNDDAAAIARIYNHYIAETCITFETEPVLDQDMAGRIADTAAVSLPWLVAQTPAGIAGYAYASKWKGRCAYRFSVEATVYMDPGRIGAGVGTRLYAELISAIRDQSMHAVIGGIALPNERSVRLHERLGFRKVAHFEQVGHKHGRWIDVGYWQLLL